jgi:hypothetical protein
MGDVGAGGHGHDQQPAVGLGNRARGVIAGTTLSFEVQRTVLTSDPTDVGRIARHGGRRAGADRFDTALRSYVNVNAHRIATAADVTAAFEDLPEVIDLFRQVGALE